jgi:hypothetical protein
MPCLLGQLPAYRRFQPPSTRVVGGANLRSRMSSRKPLCSFLSVPPCMGALASSNLDDIFTSIPGIAA